METPATGVKNAAYWPTWRRTLDRRFIVDMVKRGSITLLLPAVLDLLARMNELNVELIRKLQ